MSATIGREQMTGEAQIDQDLQREADRLLSAMSERGLTVRLLGGIAIARALGDRLHSDFAREPGDIDLITTKHDGSGVEAALSELGWEPERQFNAINGARRLLFCDPVSGRKLDVFVGRFEMCHRLPLVDRIGIAPDTISPADLLLTKMQIVELNAKDRSDCYALLLGFGTSEAGGPDSIELPWIAEATAADWGLYHTVDLNLGRLRAGLAETGLGGEERGRIEEEIDRIEAAMSAHPKSRGWKMRDRIGERKRWYEEPAEIG